jgi:predicted oxidoreductase (fatty acid repression mutant protein)
VPYPFYIFTLSYYPFTVSAVKSSIPRRQNANTQQVLFYIDTPTVEGFQANFALYADRFPQWATESSGAHQIAAWAAFEAEGLGANLQHYNPLIDEKVKAAWNVPEGWALQAELVIGAPVAPAGEKTFKEVAGERLKVYGA